MVKTSYKSLLLSYVYNLIKVSDIRSELFIVCLNFENDKKVQIKHQIFNKYLTKMMNKFVQYIYNLTYFVTIQ